ncbi:MAG: ribonucleotide-diphosphate reductase subunit alpha, partial [Candidatus Microgenomates bacterium]
ASQAWATGDPGLINLSAINRGTALANPLLSRKGPIMATNVCGEIPCYPYESCNLGYLNFPKFVNNGAFNFERFGEVIKVAIRFLDNVIDASWFPVREVEKAVRAHRRLGLGGVGWAETLIMLGIAYDSPAALELAEKVAKTMYKTAFAASCDLAKEKGPFPLVNDSIWAGKKTKPRNIALLTYPPSSGNAVICETSYGIEPLFALAYEQNVLEGMKFKNINKLFLAELTKKKLYSDKLIQKIIDNHGSCQGIPEIPKSLQKIYKVAHDISWRDHLKMQAAFQKWTDNAITKTINMPAGATTEDVKEAYLMAWRLGCKGLTIYRDQSKINQVIQFGGSAASTVKKKEYKCPTCNLKLVRDGHGKCLKCKKCGFSTCEL